MLPVRLLIICLVCALAACHNRIENQEQVRKDLMEYLSGKVGLDLKSVDVDITKIQFANNQAHATVSFHQKNDPIISNGMVMNYTLEPEKGHWVVKSRSDSQGRGMGAPSAPGGDLPPGHPPVEQPEQSLPPGHPAIGGSQQTSPKGVAQEPAQ